MALVKAGGNPHAMADFVCTYLKRAEPLRSPRRREMEKLKSREITRALKLATDLRVIADGLEGYYSEFDDSTRRSPAALIALREVLEGEAIALEHRAGTQRKLARLKPHKLLAAELWEHLVPMTGKPHDQLVANLLNTLDPEARRRPARDIKDWRRRHPQEPIRPGEWIIGYMSPRPLPPVDWEHLLREDKL